MTFTTPTERDRYRTRSIRNVIQTTIVRPLSKKRLITFRILRAVVPAYRARRRRHRRVKTAPFALAAGRPRRARRRLERHFSAARRSGGRRARRESLVRRRVRVWIDALRPRPRRASTAGAPRDRRALVVLRRRAASACAALPAARAVSRRCDAREGTVRVLDGLVATPAIFASGARRSRGFSRRGRRTGSRNSSH